jgi:hypothetical protein
MLVEPISGVDDICRHSDWLAVLDKTAYNRGGPQLATMGR